MTSSVWSMGCQLLKIRNRAVIIMVHGWERNASRLFRIRFVRQSIVVLEEKPKDFEEFLKKLEEQGI